MKIGLVMCGEHKQKGSHKAQNLYTSERFQQDFERASKVCEKVFILSAKHGLLDPESLICDYNESLKNLLLDERTDWAKEVFKSLAKMINQEDSIHFFAESVYYEELRKLLDEEDYKIFIY